MRRWKLEDAKSGFSDVVRLVEFLQASPLAEALVAGELDLTRTEDLGRDVEL